MAKAAHKPAPRPELQPDEPLALTVATGYAREATHSLSFIQHARPNAVRQNFDELAKAEAMLDGALEIVRAHKEKWRDKL